MAVTIHRYNHTARKFLAGDVDIENMKVMLLTNDASFTATNTELDQVNNSGAYEVYGNGWTQGGELLDGAAVTTVATNGAMLDANDISVTATGAPIGPAYKMVIYDDSDEDDAPLWFVDFGEAQTAGTGTPFIVAIHGNGLFRITDPE